MIKLGLASPYKSNIQVDKYNIFSHMWNYATIIQEY